MKTPVVTIGIRGGIGTIGYATDGIDLAAIPGVPAGFHGGTFVVNGYGRMSLRNAAGEMVIARPGYAVFVGSAGQAIGEPVRFDVASMKALVKATTSRGGQRGGFTKDGAVKRLAGLSIGHLVDVPVAVPRPPSVNALDFTSVFAIGNALARNQAQARQAMQLATMLAAPAAVTTTPVAATTPVATTPVASASVATTPVATSPVATASVATTPVATTPVATTPVATAPVATTPVATTPVATSPVAATPVATTPVATTPVATTPVATTPVATTPVATTPVATTPVATTSVATAPVATTPVATSPAQPATQTVYNINVATVSASVIYAHTIEAGTITAKQIIYGTSYGSSSGQTINGNSYATSGQLVAHDIQAGRVIADTIYVDFINHCWPRSPCRCSPCR